MILICALLLYIIILGAVLMEPCGTELDIALRLINKRLTPLGINVDITFHGDKTVTLTATKQDGLNVQHATITGNSLIDVLWKLIRYIEQNILDWITKQLY